MAEQDTPWKKASQGNVITLKEGESITGDFISLEESRMYKDSFALKIKQDESEQPSVIFVSNIVKDLIETEEIKKGQTIKLTYLGMKQNESGSREYKNYELNYLPQ